VIAYAWLLHAPRVTGWLQQSGSMQVAPSSAIIVAGDGSLKQSPRRHARVPSTLRREDKPSTDEGDAFYIWAALIVLLALLAVLSSRLISTSATDAHCVRQGNIREPCRGLKMDATLSAHATSARMLSIFAVGAVTLAMIVAVQVDAARIRARVDRSFGVDVVDFDRSAPNLHHVWRRRNPAMRELSRGPLKLTSFGKDMIRLRNSSWLELCKIDSDGDGMSNGAELGDPCCTWVPGKVEPYRVWNLSDPAEASDPINGYSSLDRKDAASRYMNDLRPASCEEPFDVAARARQFQEQYYLTHKEDRAAPDGLRMFKYPCFLATALLLGDWILRKGLLRDLFGCGPEAWDRPTDLQALRRLSIWVLAYLWTDGVAGLVHLTFDFCPRSYPFLGSVATGFQYHHIHPTAWAVVPLAVMLSHSLPLMGILSATLAVTQQKRCFRAFWTLTLVFFVMTVLTHRWVHMPPEGNYKWFKMLQQTGLLMSHEHHMKHHDSLVQQFSNLSGVTDFVLDYLCSVVPAWEYQHWLTVTLVYFAVPIIAGAGALCKELPGHEGLSMKHPEKRLQD